MKWLKRGLVYAPKGDLWWARTHAYLPTAEVIRQDLVRVYFAGLDTDKLGRIGYVEFDPSEPQTILCETQAPVLDVGELGTFDDSGVTPSCVVNVRGNKFLYYIGWQRAARVPYMLFSGLAIEKGNGFRKHARVPILDRTDQEPLLRSAPTVIEDDGIFRMWYVSARAWETMDARLVPTYIIRYAESRDGIVWASRAGVSIEFESQDEFGFGRPWVIKDPGVYRMWYSIRSKTRPYRIGYAESFDGLKWVRKDDEVGIEASAQGWDSEMICFPCVVDVRGKRYMFYNGNRHGETGFGYAELVSE